MIARAGLFLRTVRHLGARQIATRALRTAERAWWRATRAKPRSVPPPPLRPHEPAWRALAEDREAIARAEEVLAGRFTFLGQTREVRDWHAPDAPHLWRFHLHYFDYLHDLAVFALHRDRDAASRKYYELTRSWIDAHQHLGGDAWHPYTTSLRIVNWIEGALFFGDAELAPSIAAQAEFLSRHVEWDVRGNHLLENARALVRASRFFEGDRWGGTARAILAREIPEQILADGGHFERTPGYHARAMEVLEDIGEHHTVARMKTFLDAIVPPNGRLPLLKDTTVEDRHSCLSGQAGLPVLHQWLSASGFAVIRDDTRGDHLIADFGRVCPDYLPAHAHADLFSYELTIGGRPVVVDSGVYEYEAGEWRSWFRSTPAHNTVAIDDRDQSEMWGSFRAGRRARVIDVAWRDDAELTAIDGTHDGYAPLLHRRIIGHVRDARVWFVLDRINGPAGHAAKSYIHIHPDCDRIALTPLGDARVSNEEGWYSERFGEKRRNRVIVLTAATPAWFGYVIGADAAPAAKLDNGTLEVAGRRFNFAR